MEEDLRRRTTRALGQVLAAANLQIVHGPTPLGAAAENRVYALRLAGVAADLSGPLVLRCYPAEREPRGVRLEAALHEALARQGFPVPRIHATCEDPSLLGGAFLLMERLPGRPPLDEVRRLDEILASPLAASRTLPRLLFEAARTVPRALATAHAWLHSLDAEPIAEAIAAQGFGLDPFTAEGRLREVEDLAAEASLDGLAPALEWLRRRLPPRGRPAVCHGDLQFLNVLVRGHRISGVLDWSPEHFALDLPAFDVGNTTALLALRVPGLPPLARPIVESAQRRLLRRYRKLYARSRAVDPQQVRWAEVFRYVRELCLAGTLLRRGAAPARRFLRDGEVPWLVPEVLRATTEAIEVRCGARVWLPQPSDEIASTETDTRRSHPG